MAARLLPMALSQPRQCNPTAPSSGQCCRRSAGPFGADEGRRKRLSPLTLHLVGKPSELQRLHPRRGSSFQRLIFSNHGRSSTTNALWSGQRRWQGESTRRCAPWRSSTPSKAPDLADVGIAKCPPSFSRWTADRYAGNPSHHLGSLSNTVGRVRHAVTIIVAGRAPDRATDVGNISRILLLART